MGADFTKEDEISRMCEDILKLYPDGIDILVNNAGKDVEKAVFGNRQSKLTG